MTKTQLRELRRSVSVALSSRKGRGYETDQSPIYRVRCASSAVRIAASQELSAYLHSKSEALITAMYKEAQAAGEIRRHLEELHAFMGGDR